jgi:hypothetical protein
VPFIQEKENKKIKLFGIKLLNQLAQNEGSHPLILQQVTRRANEEKHPLMMIWNNMYHLKKKGNNLTQHEKEHYEGYLEVLTRIKNQTFNQYISERMNIVIIIIKTIKNSDSTAILNESVKLIRHLSSSKKVIETLYEKEVIL